MFADWKNGAEKTVKMIPGSERFFIGVIGPGAALVPFMWAQSSVRLDTFQPIDIALDGANFGVWFIWALSFLVTWRTPEDTIFKCALTSLGLPGLFIGVVGYGAQIVVN
ncbi:hypothetical protein [Pelagibius sp.]|uniref:hypothetical protein n=1 Tax=Pelagibius sp. TaxID=1931238 RepID=UPI003BB0E5EE